MKRIILAIAVLFGCLSPQMATSQSGVAPDSIGAYACQKSVIYDASSAAAVLVGTGGVQTGNGGLIVICGYVLFSAGTSNVGLEYGTGTTCGTGTTKITPAYELTAQTGISDSSVFFRGMTVPVGNSLCITNSGSVAIQAIVYYQQ